MNVPPARKNMFKRFSPRIVPHRAPQPESAVKIGSLPFNSINAVPLTAIENALVLAAARRLMRPADSAPLGTIRSLAYFLPVIEEVLSLRVHPDYFRYLLYKIERLAEAQ